MPAHPTALASWLAPAALATAACFSGASAQEDWPSRIGPYLDRMAAPATDDGFTAVGEDLHGALAAGASDGIPLELEAGNEYLVIAGCDDDCSDMDLEAYDPAGREMDSDVEYDDVPVVTLIPERTAAHRLVIGMVTCSREPCYYGARVLRRPASEPSEHHQLVRQQLESFGGRMAERGYQQTHGFRFGTLDEGENREFMLRLKAGTTYGIGAFCDGDCADLDLAAFAGGTEPVAQDVEADDYPALDIEVTASGVFTIRVSMARCSNAPCVYGVALYGKPTGG